jgi:hypothetical protein
MEKSSYDGDRPDDPRRHAELGEFAMRERHVSVRHVHGASLAAEREAPGFVVDAERDVEGGRGHRAGAPVEPLDPGHFYPKLRRQEAGMSRGGDADEKYEG